MRATSNIALHLLLTFATPILSAPVPSTIPPSAHIEELECAHYASCRPSYRSMIRYWMEHQPHSKPPQDPHFPSRQLVQQPDVLAKPEKQLVLPTTKTEDGSRSPHIVSDLLEILSHEQPTPVTLYKDPHPATPSSQIQRLRDEDAKRFGFGPTRECSSTSYTYSHGHLYSRKGNVDILVVGIALLFLVAIVLVEALEATIESSRRILGLRGAIRLEGEEGRLPSYSDAQTSHIQTNASLSSLQEKV